MDLVLGFVGMANAGKDTANQFVAEHFVDMSVTHVNKATGVRFHKSENGKIGYFHTPLALEVKREYLADNPNLDLTLDDLLYNAAKKIQHREGLIQKGDGNRENIDPLYWLKRVGAAITHLREECKDMEHRIFSITDMRYENELPYMEDWCYRNKIPLFSTKVIASLNTIMHRMGSSAGEYLRKHILNASERNVKRVHADFEIWNDGCREGLRENITTDIIPILKVVLLG